jgi:predicted GIY-YIG superfamily endonuclease
MNLVKPIWFNYIIFENKSKTYIGATVNPDRRLRQHNSEIKGGAKYTRGGKWNYYAIIYKLNSNKNEMLSHEWHLKHVKKFKLKTDPKKRRKSCLEKIINSKTKIKYDYILFVSEKYIKYFPIVKKTVFIFIVNDFSFKNLNEKINFINNINKFTSSNI